MASPRVVVLRKGTVMRRVPYLFLVSNPKLASATVVPLVRTQLGATNTGVDRVESYRYPFALVARHTAPVLVQLAVQPCARPL